MLAVRKQDTKVSQYRLVTIWHITALHCFSNVITVVDL